MPAISSFDYAVVRVVPRVERGEFLNAGVLVYCRGKDFLAAKVALDEARLEALFPGVDTALVRNHLQAFERICRGEGPIGALSQSERFHWLVAPKSTVVQVSPVHSGVCDAPDAQLEHLFQQLVARPRSP